MVKQWSLALAAVCAAIPALSAPAAKKPRAKKPPVKPAAKKPAPAKPAAPKPAAAKPPTPAPAAAPRVPELLRGPINVRLLQREGRVKVATSKLSEGTADLVFDGNRNTFARAEVPEGAPPAGFWQVTLDRPRLLDEVNVDFPSPHSWAFFAADSEADMASRSGSFRQLSPPRTPQFEGRDQLTFPAPKAYRVYRVEARKLSGEGGPELAEWSLWTPQAASRITVDCFVPNVALGEKIQLRADLHLEAGARENVTPEASWEVTPLAAGAVDDLGRFEGKVAGPAQVTAIVNGRRSAPFAIEVLPQGMPDWTVTYIERQPRLHYGEPNAGLKEGQTVYWFAHVRNYGTGGAEPASVEWRLDGKTIRSGSLPKLERFNQTEVILGIPWDGAPHELELIVDGENAVAEVSETNNRLTVRTDALSVGFWVEDSALRYFHRHQKELGAGSNSFEDWAQRQVAFWNRWMESSGWLWPTPRLAATRFRLDRIIVVGDGMLPMAGGSAIFNPDRRDDTVHISVGVPAYDPAHDPLYRRTAERTLDNPFYFQASLFQALRPLRPKPQATEAKGQ